jgi:hypothetical protein
VLRHPEHRHAGRLFVQLCVFSTGDYAKIVIPLTLDLWAVFGWGAIRIGTPIRARGALGDGDRREVDLTPSTGDGVDRVSDHIHFACP